MKPVIIIVIAFVLLIPTTTFAQIEPNIDKKSIFNDKKFDTTTKLTNHNGIPFYFEFDRDFSELENDTYYQLYKIIDSRNNQHIGDLRIYLGSSQWWDDNAFLQEKDSSGFSNIIKVKLFVLHMTEPKKIEDVANSLSFALKTLIPKWSKETSSVSVDDWFFDSINNAKRNDENKREDRIIIENKEITVFHDDVDFGSITIIVTENLDVTYSNYVLEDNELLEEIFDFTESEPKCDLGEYTPIEDYSLISELASQGLTEKNLDTSKILVEYKGNTQYDNECQSLYSEYKQIGEESKTWKNSCANLGEFPNADQIREMYYVIDGVCRFATLTAVEQTVDESEIVCGKGTVEKNGQCVVDTSKTLESEPSRGGGCLIATATYGSELAPQVQQLRELRDNSLLNTESGSAFMNTFNGIYYAFSPIIADLERENPVFREMVKVAITPMISSLSILNYVDMDSEVEVLGYGISLILLNLGIYFAVPVIVIMRIRNG